VNWRMVREIPRAMQSAVEAATTHLLTSWPPCGVGGLVGLVGLVWDWWAWWDWGLGLSRMRT